MFALSVIFEHGFGISYFAFGGFYFMYGFLIFTEWGMKPHTCQARNLPRLQLYACLLK